MRPGFVLLLVILGLLLLFMVSTAKAQGGAPPTGICATTDTGWAVFANNRVTTCHFAFDVFYALQRYQAAGNTIRYGAFTVIPLRSSTTGHLWRLRCLTEDFPAVSALCLARPGMNVTVSRIIEAGE